MSPESSPAFRVYGFFFFVSEIKASKQAVYHKKLHLTFFCLGSYSFRSFSYYKKQNLQIGLN